MASYLPPEGNSFTDFCRPVYTECYKQSVVIKTIPYAQSCIFNPLTAENGSAIICFHNLRPTLLVSAHSEEGFRWIVNYRMGSKGEEYGLS